MNYECLKLVIFFRALTEEDIHQKMIKSGDRFTRMEIQQQWARHCVVRTIIKDAELEDEYRKWKAEHP